MKKVLLIILTLFLITGCSFKDLFIKENEKQKYLSGKINIEIIVKDYANKVTTNVVSELNNKGITLVEVIVSFALLMIILVGLFNIIMEVKSDVTDKQMEKLYETPFLMIRDTSLLLGIVSFCKRINPQNISQGLILIQKFPVTKLT